MDFLYLLYCVINFCVKLYFFIYFFFYKNYITNIFDKVLAYKGCHDTFFFSYFSPNNFWFSLEFPYCGNSNNYQHIF